MASASKNYVSSASRHARSLFGEFKNFALKGSVIDLAVGFIIGTAFGAIVKSLVDDIMMPLIGIIMPGEKGYVSWTVDVPTPWGGVSAIPYGKFLGAVINFLIVAGSLFIFIRFFLRWVLWTKKEEAAAPPPPTREQELLTEIRDLLKNRPA